MKPSPGGSTTSTAQLRPNYVDAYSSEASRGPGPSVPPGRAARPAPDHRASASLCGRTKGENLSHPSVGRPSAARPPTAPARVPRRGISLIDSWTFD